MCTLSGHCLLCMPAKFRYDLATLAMLSVRPLHVSFCLLLYILPNRIIPCPSNSRQACNNLPASSDARLTLCRVFSVSPLLYPVCPLLSSPICHRLPLHSCHPSWPLNPPSGPLPTSSPYPPPPRPTVSFTDHCTSRPHFTYHLAISRLELCDSGHTMPMVSIILIYPIPSPILSNLIFTLQTPSPNPT
jgi:hypothetical protein